MEKRRMIASRRMSAAVLLIAAVFSASPSLAQNLVPLDDIELNGTIHNINPRVIQVRTPKGDFTGDLINGPIGPARIEFRGEATSEDLEPGLYVRFSAEVEFKKRVEGEVSAVTIFGREGQRGPVAPQPNVFVFGAAEEQPKFGFLLEDVVDEAPGIRPGAVPKLAKYTVVGRVKSAPRRGIMTIELPDDGDLKSLKVPLAADAKIQYELSDASLARPGDAVLVKGSVVPGANRGQFLANSVTITRGNPIADVPAVGVADNAAVPPRADAFAADKPRAEEKKKDDDGPKYEGVILKIN